MYGRRPFTQATHERRLKEGRGQGDGPSYRPYIYVQDFSSLGQSNRDFGLTAERQHDLFSKLEHRVYLVYDNSFLCDIKEQYPLPLETTLAIAQECGIRHPADRHTKEPIPITTDLVLTVPLPIGTKRVARSVKYSKDLGKRRVLEKLELERRAWKHSGADWGIITEKDVNPNLIRNLLWSYKFRHVDSLYPLSPEDVPAISRVLTNAVLSKDLPLCDTALFCDQDLGLPAGTSLSLARHLLASRQWCVNWCLLIVPTDRISLLRIALST